MAEVKKIIEGLWTFPIVLPNNPLKWLNCYVAKGMNSGRNLLIDTGFNIPECYAALQDGMEALELSPDNTDVFITHVHSDHAGNASKLGELGYRIYMGELDYGLFLEAYKSSYAIDSDRLYKEGLKITVTEKMYSRANKMLGNPGMFKANLLKEGDMLNYGRFQFKCIETPGHTPGHMCLYDEKTKTMVLGDHVLFDISPNICCWPNVEDSLGDYINSLKKIDQYDVEYALTAHRNINAKTMHERVQELLAHHDRRLKQAERIISETPRISAYELAAVMSWKIRARNWEEFPMVQKYFALSETLSHLDYLVAHERIMKHTDPRGNITYCLPSF